jgi:hypothetical protein
MISDIGRLSPTKRKELREAKELPSRSKLTKELLFRSACTLISEAQSTAFETELKHFKRKAVWPSDSTLAKVAAYMDRMGVIRAQGRTLLQVGTPPLVRHPIVLDGRDEISRLLIRLEHEKLGHNQGVTKLQLAIQQVFTMRAPRERCSTIEKQCVTCQKIKGKAGIQLMGIPFDLELGTTKSIKPFSIVALDFAGPYYVTLNRSRLKAYILIATCLQIKALHLEMTISMNTDSLGGP